MKIDELAKFTKPMEHIPWAKSINDQYLILSNNTGRVSLISENNILCLHKEKPKKYIKEIRLIKSVWLIVIENENIANWYTLTDVINEGQNEWMNNRFPKVTILENINLDEKVNELFDDWQSVNLLKFWATKINEIKLVDDIKISWEKYESYFNKSIKIDTIDNIWDLSEIAIGNYIIIFASKLDNICAMTIFEKSNEPNGLIARNAVTKQESIGNNLIAKIYKRIIDDGKTVIVSDTIQTPGGRAVWTKGLQKLGINPIVVNTEDGSSFSLKQCDPYIKKNVDTHLMLIGKFLPLAESNMCRPGIGFYMPYTNKVNKLYERSTISSKQLFEKIDKYLQ